MAKNKQNFQREIASLEQAVRDAVEETDKAERALVDLEGRRNEAEGRLAIARQAEADYATRLEECRQALAQALEAEARAKLHEAVSDRGDAANRVVDAIAHLFASFEQLAAARTATAERVAEMESYLGRPVEVEPEPAKLEQGWARLVDFMRTEAKLRLDDELIEAAVSSPLGHDINKLPKHLALVARRRYAERAQAASRGDSPRKRDG